MKNQEEKIYVCAGWQSNERIGILFRNMVNGNEVISFQYDPSWLSKYRTLLDPLLPPVTYRIYSGDKQLFGAFEDSCPDRWGRRLLDRRESVKAYNEKRHPKKFLETDYLLEVQDVCRQGGFRFSTDGYTFLSGDDVMSVPPIASLRELEQISLGYESGDDERWITRLVEPGSSLGGARPKANVVDTDGSLWIAKFPSKNDEYDIGAWEKTVHDIAEKCGIRVPEARIACFSGQGHTFLVRRFDRNRTNGENIRLHYASAMTMLGARDGHTDGFGFLDLAEKTAQITDNTNQELKELFRRMVFDIAVSNQDDHLRNHGFLLRKGRWELAPAFDINPVNRADYLAMNIDLDDGYRSFDKAVGTCEFYHLSREAAEKIVQDICRVTASSWKETARKNGLSEQEIRWMSPAFALAEQYNDHL